MTEDVKARLRPADLIVSGRQKRHMSFVSWTATDLRCRRLLALANAARDHRSTRRGRQTTVEQLRAAQYVFVGVDSTPARALLLDRLPAWGVSDTDTDTDMGAEL